MNYRIAMIPVAALLLFASCTTHPPNRGLIQSDTHIIAPPAISEKIDFESASSPGTASKPAQETRFIEKLTLVDTLDLVTKHNPTLSAYNEEIRAKNAMAIKSGLLPNPTLGIEVDNFAGKDDLKGFKGGETTVSISQVVELGNKRGKRRNIATIEKDIAVWDYQSKRLDLICAATKSFFQVLTAQNQVFLNDDLVKLAEKIYNAVSERANAGKVSPIEKNKVIVELASARNETMRSRRELEAARRRLTAFFGSAQTEFKEISGDLAQINPPIPEETGINQLNNNPDLSRWKSELELKKSLVSFAQSKAIPDLTVNMGLRRFQETKNNAFVAGFEFPLPLFDRNQGEISEALANTEKARQEHKAVESELRAGLSETWQNLSAAYEESLSLQNVILPEAKKTFEALETGYREGKLDILQVLDVQRTLFTSRRQYLKTLEEYHKARADLDRLIGLPLEILPDDPLKTVIKTNK